MAQPTISQIRDCMRSGRYVVTHHATKGLSDDNLAEPDIQRIILSGQIVERQRDRYTGERKYVIRGHALAGCAAEVVVKLESSSGKLYIITVYLD